ncbi:MAG: hypothetical protein K0S57_3266 [Ramlibacter sp.]|nr:hypothetical protein [Ramlibacter sp.]
MRPSISTSSLLPMASLKPRALMAYWPELRRATCRLGASRRASGRLVALERRMSSPLITNTDAGALRRLSGRPLTEVTGRSLSCSSDSSARLPGPVATTWPQASG